MKSPFRVQGAFRSRRAAPAALLLALLPACEAANTAGPDRQDESATFALAAPDTLFRSIGDTLTLAAQTPSGGRISADRIEWTSSDSAVVRVERGIVVARADGRATVTGRVGENESSWTFRVRQTAARLELSSPEYGIPGSGGSVQLAATARDRRGNPIPGAPLGWTSDAPARISVSGSGLATAAGWGSARVRVSAGAGIVSEARVRVTGGSAPSVARLRARVVPGGSDPAPAFAVVMLEAVDAERDLDSVRVTLLDANGGPVAVVADTAVFGEPTFTLELHATRAERVSRLRLELVDHAGNRTTQTADVPPNSGPASPKVDEARWARIAGDSVRVNLAITDPELDVELLWAVGLNEAGGWTFIRGFEVPEVDASSWVGSLEFADPAIARSAHLGILALDRAGNVSALFLQPGTAVSSSVAPSFSRTGTAAASLRARTAGPRGAVHLLPAR